MSIRRTALICATLAVASLTVASASAAPMNPGAALKDAAALNSQIEPARWICDYHRWGGRHCWWQPRVYGYYWRPRPRYWGYYGHRRWR